MRKPLLPLLILAAALPLGGCAALPFLPAAAELVRAETQRGVIGEDFGAAASEACTARGTRYGRTTVTSLQPQTGGSMQVFGTVERSDGTRNFVCIFRSSGSIASFKMS